MGAPVPGDIDIAAATRLQPDVATEMAKEASKTDPEGSALSAHSPLQLVPPPKPHQTAC